MLDMEYNATCFVGVYNTIKGIVESISWCIANEDYYHFYLYLSEYCEWVYKHYDLIQLFFNDFQDVLLFDLETQDFNYFKNADFNYKD